mmetsp:Transcript_10456/g.29868  ORF Transcript_10456/g.29868 Transcript_10456/m.29868 type:complete len:733 (+) Transcript_10456:189-2387(+)
MSTAVTQAAEEQTQAPQETTTPPPALPPMSTQVTTVNQTESDTQIEIINDSDAARADDVANGDEAEVTAPVVDATDDAGAVETEAEAAAAATETGDAAQAVAEEDHSDGQQNGIKVLFLSSDTGGGHRASAESLAKQFELLFPGSTYELLDVAAEAYLPPYNSIVSAYKHLSAHPSQWNMLYKVTNSKTMERIVDTNIRVMTMMCERSMRRKLNSYDADVVVSVHPLMTHVPIQSCAKISHETGQHLPIFTVVTDLGSAHTTWFANGVERMFVGSTQIYDLAKDRGKVPDEKLVLVGLPIRHDFAVQAEKLGDRVSPEGQAYQRSVREKLGLPAVNRKTLLVMGGGEGVGSLSNIVNALYVELVKQGIDAVILVVCGRNEVLKESLAARDWSQVMERSREKSKPLTPASGSRGSLSNMFSMSRSYASPISACTDTPTVLSGCIEGGLVTASLRRILSTGSMTNASAVIVPTSPSSANHTSLDGAGEEEKKNEEEIASIVAQSKSGEEFDEKQKSNSLNALDFDSKIGPILTDDDKTDNAEGDGADATQEEKVADPTNDATDVDAAATTSTTTTEPPSAAPPAAETKAEDKDDIVSPGCVDVVGLGFVTNMAEYMVAADILISKAGPGTISEAAALSLPVMLTSFLPGQEEGNIDFVVDGGFGAYCNDSDPDSVAEEVALWLNDPIKMAKLAAAAKAKGAPYAARDIVKQIGESTLAWRAINQQAKNDKAEGK